MNDSPRRHDPVPFLFFIPLILMILGIALQIGIGRTDWYRRHYGFGSSDAIRIVCIADGEVLPTSEYAISDVLLSNHEVSVHRAKYMYSFLGDYGTYYYDLEWNGKHTHFFLENTDSWRRTDLFLYIDSDSDTVTQYEYLYNANMPFVSAFANQWAREGEEVHHPSPVFQPPLKRISVD